MAPDSIWHRASTVVCTTDDRDAWLAARRHGIGSSDAAIILSGGLYGKTAHDIWLDKVNGSVDDTPPTERMRWGLILEPIVRQELAKEVGVPVEDAGILLRSERWPFLQDTPDGVVDGRYPLEMKVSGRAEWGDHVPRDVWIQCQHHLAITGADKCLAASLLCRYGVEGLHWAWVERDDGWLDMHHVPTLQKVWDRVQANEPLDPDASETCARVFAHWFPLPKPQSVAVLGGEALDWDAQREEAAQAIKEAEARKREAENRIRHAIGSNERGELPDGTAYSWKPNKNGTRTLRRHARKDPR